MWIEDVSPYPLPAGLRHLQPVTLVGKSPRYEHSCIVRDGQGVEWEVFHWQVTAGLDFQAQNGEWYPESHPATVKAIQAELAKTRAELANESDLLKRRFIEGGIKVLQDCLDRHR